MKSTARYKRALAEIRSLRERRKYADSLAAVEALLGQWPDQPALLVLRGELIQLQGEQGPSLDDAAAMLKRAAVLDDRNADALLELAHFQMAVEDDTRTADRSFVSAIAASTESLIAALVGRAGALEELGRKQEAFDCLSTARYLQNATATKNGSSGDQAGLFQ